MKAHFQTEWVIRLIKPVGRQTLPTRKVDVPVDQKPQGFAGKRKGHCTGARLTGMSTFHAPP